ncbi:MAG TPA: protein kinase [Verrucomicrobiota bacterium]|jgi:tRNA A-37 threonylcarbamoyl transferase component Bud32|nr:protein kinase [Verrucomicrobiota bacterium]HCL92661.1 serine/threonine protein kinase [Limisphaerales bacterium]HRR65254.1 protein kinase [Candidatus Paceibacterota bacterium]NLH84391.1 serine/threonine protein kinase [Verrucomicrobiota bacterium]HNR70703.1 protein kinase [Verrucomicrobiota bacterium]
MSAVNRFLIRLPRLLSKRLWAVPLAGALILGIVGLWVVKRVEETTRGELAARLQTLLQADVNALRLWFTERQYAAKSFASDARVEAAIMQLAALAQDPRATPQSLADSAPAQTLRHYLQPLLEAQEYLGYVVVAPDKRILATTGPEEIGVRAPTAYNLFLNKVLDGQLATSRPFVSQTNLSRRVEGPTMFVAAPIKTTNDVVAAVLGLRMRPEKEFTSIFSVAQIGQTGEAYAFDRSGLMLTATRFDQSLKTLGLIPPGRTNTAILNLKLLDPEGELHPGVPHPKPRSQLHLTRMAASATMGNNDFDVRGYRNYRGLKVIGAWAWLRDCGMGVAAEQSLDEAFQTLYVLRRVFLVLFGLLLASGGAIFGFTLLVEHLQAAGRKDALTARRLGQYVLMQEIGRGANGMVYRARHSLLRRPVAIKLLNPDQTNETNSARFEHEAQMTSQLTHPNTVAIYDYGRTPEGLFYFAMEYLGGIDLDQLVRRFGAQPEGRVIHILRQACGSLAEAHRIGLIHRDVKPANIILTRRGGVCDLVKVLDFGLVAAAHPGAAFGPAPRDIVGTPHFMSPEAVEKPESATIQSDLYSLGAVGYWLLTGKTLFDSDTVEGLFSRQVSSPPPPPAERLGQPVSADLAELLLRCLAKQAAQRPASAEALDQALAACASAGTWTGRDAEQWWMQHLADIETLPATVMSEKTLVIAPRS